MWYFGDQGFLFPVGSFLPIFETSVSYSGEFYLQIHQIEKVLHL